MSDILIKVEKYCKSVLVCDNCDRLPFHNLIHTQEVVNNVYEITEELNLSTLDLENVLIAAWFHDTGYSEEYIGHEEYSKKIAEKFLKQELLDQQRIDVIIKCIDVTKFGVEPDELLEKIICDADLYHLTKCDYMFRNILLRKEWEKELGKFYSESDWYEFNYKFLKEYKFHVNAEDKILNSKLNANVEKLRRLVLLN